MTTPPVPGLPQPKTLRDIDFPYYYRHYLDLLRRWIVYIVLSAPAGMALAAMALVYTGILAPPVEQVTVLIGVEAPGRVGGVRDFGQMGTYKAELLRSRGFAEEIVRKLSLQLHVHDQQRYDIFDSVRVDSLAPPGTYEFVVDGHNRQNYQLLYTNRIAGIRRRVIESGALAGLSELKVADTFLRFTRPFLLAPHDVTFDIIDMRNAVDRVLGGLTVTVPTRERDYITLVFRGRDYRLIADVANAMADHFVDQNLNFRKRRTREALVVLEKQLKRAEEQLAVSEGELRSFLSVNPNVGLSSGAQQTVAELMTLESGTVMNSTALREAQRLQQEYTNASQDAKERIASEALLFLQTRGVLTAPVLQAEFQQLLRERVELERTHAATHPALRENLAKISALGGRAMDALSTHIGDVHSLHSNKQSSIAQLSSRLRTLPAKELQLAELQRKQKIDSDIFSSVLTRLNEARVADAVEVSDVFVMDNAVPPYAAARMMRYLRLFAFALLAGLVVALLPVVFFDMTDKSVRTELELKHQTRWPVLETVPVIGSADAAGVEPKKKKRQKGPAAPVLPVKRERVIDPHLITNEAVPLLVAETFRSLHTKVKLSLAQFNLRDLIFCSLNPGEGKSTVAANFAVTMARQGSKTLLVDCDLRRGVLHNTFVKSKSPGVTDTIMPNSGGVPDTITGAIQETHVANLWLLTTGPNIPNPQELLNSDAFKSVVAWLRERYDFIIFDTPPIDVATDAVVLGTLIERVVFVVKAGSTNVADLKARIAEYPGFANKVLGTVLNMATIDKKVGRSRYKRYYY